MEFLIALPIIALPFFFPVVTGLMAQSLGRKFWFWFFMGFPLPCSMRHSALFAHPEKRQ